MLLKTCRTATREHADSAEFRKFKHQLFHSSLTRILFSLRSAMKVPEVVLFGDDYYRCVIYSLAAYIADYKEQVLLSCIVHNWCPKCLAHRTNLDEEALRRHREHTDTVIKEFEFRKLWDVYGIVGDLVVSSYSFFVITRYLIKDSHLQTISRVRISIKCSHRIFFTNSSRADSKITWWNGLRSTSSEFIRRQVQRRSLMKLTGGT